MSHTATRQIDGHDSEHSSPSVPGHHLPESGLVHLHRNAEGA
jgi:hypothetical protein